MFIINERYTPLSLQISGSNTTIPSGGAIAIEMDASLATSIIESGIGDVTVAMTSGEVTKYAEFNPEYANSSYLSIDEVTTEVITVDLVSYNWVGNQVLVKMDFKNLNPSDYPLEDAPQLKHSSDTGNSMDAISSIGDWTSDPITGTVDLQFTIASGPKYGDFDLAIEFADFSVFNKIHIVGSDSEVASNDAFVIEVVTQETSGWTEGTQLQLQDTTTLDYFFIKEFEWIDEANGLSSWRCDEIPAGSYDITLEIPTDGRVTTSNLGVLTK